MCSLPSNHSQVQAQHAPAVAQLAHHKDPTASQIAQQGHYKDACAAASEALEHMAPGIKEALAQQARVDKDGLPHGTRIWVEGRGRGSYQSMNSKKLGRGKFLLAKEHNVVFDSDGALSALALGSTRNWRVLARPEQIPRPALCGAHS